MNHTLKIEDLHVTVGDKPILRGVNPISAWKPTSNGT